MCTLLLCKLLLFVFPLSKTTTTKKGIKVLQCSTIGKCTLVPTSSKPAEHHTIDERQACHTANIATTSS